MQKYRTQAPVKDEVRDAGAFAFVSAEHECPAGSQPERDTSNGGKGVGCWIKGAEGQHIPIGKWSYRNEDGLISTGEYENGMRTGTWTEWHPNGRQASEAVFEDDSYSGVFRMWDDEGNQLVERHYVDGKLDGLLIYWRPGKATEVEVWRRGVRVSPPPDEPFIETH